MPMPGLFILKMHAYATAKGKTLQVWEGFKSNVPGETPGGAASSPVSIPQDVVVSPFDCNIYAPPNLAKDGYKIINSAWTPLCKCCLGAHILIYVQFMSRSCCCRYRGTWARRSASPCAAGVGLSLEPMAVRLCHPLA